MEFLRVQTSKKTQGKADPDTAVDSASTAVARSQKEARIEIAKPNMVSRSCKRARTD